MAAAVPLSHIFLLGTGLVRPLHPPQISRDIALGPLDYTIAPIIPIVVLFFYAHQDDDVSPSQTMNAELLPPDALKLALQVTLGGYPQLSGRLHIDPSDPSSRKITDTGRGAELITAASSIPLSSLYRGKQSVDILKLPLQGNELWAPFDPTIPFVTSTPVLSIQHTRFVDGAICLGVRILHAVTDAAGFFMFTRDLAEAYRKIRLGEGKAEIRLRAESGTQPNSGNKFDFADEKGREEFEPGFAYVGESQAKQAAHKSDIVTAADEVTSVRDSEPVEAMSTIPTVIGRFVSFSVPDLARLKSLASSPGTSGSQVSTFSALCAFLHLRIYLARSAFYTRAIIPLGSPDFLTPVDIRSRLRGSTWDVGQQYTPNATLISTSTLPIPSGPSTEDFREAFHSAASTISAQTRHTSVTDPASIARTIKWFATLPPVARSNVQYRGFTASNASLMVSSWVRLDIYEAMKMDSVPIAVRNPFTNVHLLDGLGYLLPPSPDEVEAGVGIVLAMALREEVWGALDLSVSFVLDTMSGS